jgi:hypothetical protein
MLQSRPSRIWLAAGLAFLPAVALADEMSLDLRNPQSTPVEVELYSQARANNWPGGGAFYRLDPGAAQTVHLSCTTGESICYGAWAAGDQSVIYGVGPDGVERCPECCFTCDGGSHASFQIGR